MSIVFYLLAALTVAGGLAAMLLKNTVHCALALTVAFAGLALLFLNLDAQFAGFRADSGLHWRGRHFGGLCDSAHTRL
jgi:NADH:ubiquinone oxidoreductase subunit 6 (subunit J)